MLLDQLSISTAIQLLVRSFPYKITANLTEAKDGHGYAQPPPEVLYQQIPPAVPPVIITHPHARRRHSATFRASSYAQPYSSSRPYNTDQPEQQAAGRTSPVFMYYPPSPSLDSSRLSQLDVYPPPPPNSGMFHHVFTSKIDVFRERPFT